MHYPGDSSLSDDIRQRILTTFEQALDLADSGSRREALLGCDFVLRLDPLFEPARVLHKRLTEGAGILDLTDLRNSVNGGSGSSLTLGGAPTAETEPAEPAVADSPEGSAQPVGLGDVELESLGYETGKFGALSFDDEPMEAVSFDDDPAGDSLETVSGSTGDLKAPAFDPSTQVPVLEQAEPEAMHPEPEIEAPESIAFGAVVEESREDFSPPSPPEVESELVTTFVDEPIGPTDSPFGEDSRLGADPVDDMAVPLGAPQQLDDESQRRISELLNEGQKAYNAGEYQSAIDSWSRVFLIDIDHAEANQRIEQARRMAAEEERQIEEVFHEAISHMDAGNLEQARQALIRAIELHPGHLAAQELLDRIDSGEALAGVAPSQEQAASTQAGFGIDDTYGVEEGREDLFAAPDVVPAAAELEASRPSAPRVDAKKKPRQTFLIVGSIVLVLVIVGGWYLMNSWESLFPNSEMAQGAPEVQRIDPIARAQKLHEQGKTAIAIAQLRRLPPGDPHYAEGQALVAQWETAEIGVEPDGPSDEDLARYDSLLARARQAYAQREFLLTHGLLERAAAIAPLDAETLSIQAAVNEALEPLAEQIQVFRSGDWEYALPTLWRMREADTSNADINRLIIDSYYNLGVRDLQRGRAEAALRKFEEALNLRPDDPTLQRLRAFAATYQARNEDLLYRIFVKYLPFR